MPHPRAAAHELHLVTVKPGAVVPGQRKASSLPAAAPASSGLRFLPAITLASDLVWLCVAFLLAALLSGSRLAWVPDTGPAPTLAAAVPFLVGGWALCIAACGGYERGVLGAGTAEYVRAVNATFVAAALVGIVCYLVRFQLSREFFVLASVSATVLVLIGRLLLRAGVGAARRRGRLLHRVLVVGDRAHTHEVADVLGRGPWLGYDVIGSLHGPGDAGEHRVGGGEALNRSERVAMAARAQHADVVVVTGGAFESATEIRRLAWELEHEDVQVVIAPGVTDVANERVRVRPVGGLPLVHLDKPRAAGALRRAKRTFDVVGTCALVVVLSPVFAFAALWIKLHDGGPVLASQARVGRDGQAFRLLAFRAMTSDGAATTKPGRWLRRFSLDELPQLANVLRGDMSLVGPRPPMAHEAAQGGDDMVRRLRVRPGMTGLWQVSGRRELSRSEALRLDLYYVDNWSMVQDLAILARTFGAVARGRGA